jgi:hypothetical protein
MIDIKHMDKKAVYDNMLDLLYSVNVGHFKLGSHLKEVYSSLDKTSEFNKLVTKVNGDAGRYEAKRLRKTLGIKGTDIDSMIAVLEHSHWFVFENIQVTKLTDKRFIMRTIDCSTQKASKRRGDGYTDCTIGASLSCRKAFFSEINKSAQVKKVFAPPEPRPSTIDGDVSCEWEISIE